MFEKNQCNCGKLESIAVVGLHKQIDPKTSYRFVLIVTWQDGNQTTIYRKLKEFKWFQNQLAVEVASYPEHEEASRYLAKQKKKTRTGIMTSSMGTAQHLRMIDAINMYLDVVTYYLHEVEQFRVLKYFLSPSPLDLEAPSWSKNGKTFFCCGNHNDGTGTLPQNDVSVKRSFSSNTLLSTSTVSPQNKHVRRRSVSLTSLADNDSIYVADEDHVPRDEDSSYNVIGLNAGEKVQVISKSETGWWFVKRIGESNQESCGYVPGSFLTPQKDAKLTFSENDEYTDTSDEKAIYESVCYPLSHSPKCLAECYPENLKKLIREQPDVISSEQPNVISRNHKDESVVTPSLLHQQKPGFPTINYHKAKLQNLLGSKV